MTAKLNEIVYTAIGDALVEVGASRDSAYPVYQEGVDLPAIIYGREGEDRLDAIDGHLLLGVRYRIDIRSEMYGQLERLDELCVRKLSRHATEIAPASDFVEDDIALDRVYRRIRGIVLRV